MIFGPKYYPTLDRMTDWRQSLFSLALASRQFQNFALWAELENRQGAAEFKKVLQDCWQYHFDKFNHVDLSASFEQLAPYIPDDDGRSEEEISEGERFAFDAAIALNAAVDAVTLGTDTASVASKASMAGVIRLCENRYADEELDEDSLHEKDEINAEIDFQVTLMETVQKPRSAEMIAEVLRLALSDSVSNIGLEHNLKFEDFFREEYLSEMQRMAVNESGDTEN